MVLGLRPVCPAAAVCISSVLPTRGTLQYVGINIINFGPNVESFLLALGSWRCYIVGANVPPKQFTSCPLHGTGLRGSPKGNGGNTVRIYQRMNEGATIHQGGISCDGAGRHRAGRFDSPLHSEDTVQSSGTLDAVDKARDQTGDGEGRLYYYDGQAKIL